MTPSARDRALEAWIAEGQAVRVVAELTRRGWLPRLKRSGAELVGPCPFCGGHDRFGVNPARDVWNCRRCGTGGDAIALVRHLEGVDFLRAVEILTNAPPPGRRDGEAAADRQAREARQAALVAAAREADARQAAESARYREDERRRARDIWVKARPIAGTAAEAYLHLRGLAAPAGARLRFLPDHPLWDAPPPKGTIVHRGPAMVAAIEGPDGRFAGVHLTWIDLAQPKGKALVADRTTGELVPAKKVRGSQRGGSILLAPAAEPARVLFRGEGIESVLSVRAALVKAAAAVLPVAEFRSAINLGNMAGRAADRVAHPTETRTDKAGRVRRLMVPGPTPLADREPVMAIGPTIEDEILLGDGDSDPFTTRLALERAAARDSAAYPYLTVRLAMAAEGTDFNDLWRAA